MAEVFFRFANGNPPPPPPAIAFNFRVLPDGTGFSLVIPAGYVVTTEPFQAEEDEEEVEQEAEQEDGDELYNRDQIILDSANRLLTRGEVSFLLRTDSIEATGVIERTPIAGLFMYGKNYLRSGDGYAYLPQTINESIQIGNNTIRYISKRVISAPIPIATRKYYIWNGGDKVLVHYLAGEQHQEEPEGFIPN